MDATAPTHDPTAATRLITLGYLRPPLSANEKLNRYAENRISGEVRERAGWLVRAARLGTHPHIVVELLWRPGVRRRRDGAENVTPTLKPLVDGIVDAGVVPDDTPEFVTRRMPALLAVQGPHAAGMWLAITPSAPPLALCPPVP